MHVFNDPAFDIFEWFNQTDTGSSLNLSNITAVDLLFADEP